MRASLLPYFFAVAPLFATSLALAQGTPITDQVQTTDGGTYRGTIIEDTPKGDVVLQLPTGETKRFSRATIRYAGPLAGATESPVAPERSTSPFTVQTRPVSVRFEASEPSTLYAEGDWAVGTNTGLKAKGYSRLCTSPCSLSVPLGTQRFALARGPDAPRDVVASAPVQDPSTLHAEWHSAKGARVAGILILAVGVPVGALAASAGFAVGYNTDSCNTPGCYGTPRMLTWVGLGVAIASAVAGTVLVTRRDTATIELTPLQIAPAAGAAAGSTSNPDAKPLSLGATGTAVTVRF
jgi:hypothetical protein